MQVYGNSTGARTLGEDVGNCAYAVLKETEDIDGKLKKLGSSFQDEDYSSFKESIEKVYKQVWDIMPVLQAIKPKLDQYASILDRAKMNG